MLGQVRCSCRRRGVVVSGTQRESGEVDGCGPAFAFAHELRHLVECEVHTGCAQQPLPFGRRQRKVAGADLHEPAGGSERRDRQPRTGAAGEDKRRALADLIRDGTEHLHRFDGTQQVDVVDDDHDRLSRRDHRRNSRQDRRPDRLHGPGQGVENLRPERCDRVECRSEVSQQDDRVGIVVVDGNPHERPWIAFRPLCEQRRLAVSHRGEHRHQGCIEIGSESIDEDCPGNESRPEDRDANLRIDNVERQGPRVCAGRTCGVRGRFRAGRHGQAGRSTGTPSSSAAASASLRPLTPSLR